MKTRIRNIKCPPTKTKNVFKVMSANKAKNTKPEVLLRKELWKNSIRGYRTHYKKAPGTPDLCFVSKKIAVFVNGCFWHRCPKCKLHVPNINKQYWEEKFNRNVIRDKNKILQLKKIGWKVITIWECQINLDLKSVVDKVKKVTHN